MNFWIVFLVIGIVVGIVFLSRITRTSDQARLDYLKALADFIEGTFGESAEFANSYQITFGHQGVDFVFEDIEDVGIRTKIYRGYLKGKSKSSLTLTFTEKPKTAIRSSAKSISDLASGWAMDKISVYLPKDLKRFNIHTNDANKTEKLFADENVGKVFSSFFNQGLRGDPVMSLEIIEGVVTLKFHPKEGMEPNLLNLRHNITTIDEYLDPLIVVIKRLNTIEAESKD